LEHFEKIHFVSFPLRIMTSLARSQ